MTFPDRLYNLHNNNTLCHGLLIITSILISASLLQLKSLISLFIFTCLPNISSSPLTFTLSCSASLVPVAWVFPFAGSDSCLSQVVCFWFFSCFDSRPLTLPLAPLSDCPPWLQISPCVDLVFLNSGWLLWCRCPVTRLTVTLVCSREFSAAGFHLECICTLLHSSFPCSWLVS